MKCDAMNATGATMQRSDERDGAEVLFDPIAPRAEIPGLVAEAEKHADTDGAADRAAWAGSGAYQEVGRGRPADCLPRFGGVH